MSTVLISLAVALLLAGTIIIFASPSGSSKVTIHNEGSIVTVRSASRSDVTISFDPTGIPGEEQPAVLAPGSEPFDENEPTLLEEFMDPKTTAERKHEIAKSFQELNYKVCFKDKIADVPVAPAGSQQTWEDDGCDEGMVPPEPDEYYDE